MRFTPAPVKFSERVRQVLAQLPGEPSPPTRVRDSLQGHVATCFCGWTGTEFPMGSRQMADSEAATHQCAATARWGERMKASWVVPLLREADQRVAELEAALAGHAEAFRNVEAQRVQALDALQRSEETIRAMKRSWQWLGKRSP